VTTDPRAVQQFGNTARTWRWPTNSPATVAHRDERDALARALGVTPTMAGLLIARGCEDADAAARFLQPELEHLHDPLLLPDADAAAERIAQAIQAGEKILVHGDYDVDGVTGAALLTRVLEVLGARVECFIPHRQEDGYDLRVATVQRVHAEGVRLIVTVDCGIVAFQAAEAARELGVDLVITDHHEPDPERLPDACAVVNPKRRDSTYPFPHLAGVGVAYKVATAVVRRMGQPEASFRKNFLDLVALGTVADCMPLVGENRVLVKFGLAALAATKKHGLRALLRSAGVKELNARSLGFSLGPRINAVGRLDAAAHALNLLLTKDPAQAAELAEKLERCNRDRQAQQSRIFDEAMAQAREMDECARPGDDPGGRPGGGPSACLVHPPPVLVLASATWHGGVIGIVASKLVEALGRPTVMIALDGELGRGSARSVHGFHIFEALGRCRDHLVRVGGHQAAAGFDIEAARVPALREALAAVAAEMLPPDGAALSPSIVVDDLLEPHEITLQLAQELALLEPCGHGNPEPRFGSRGLLLAEARRLTPRVAGTADHLLLKLSALGARRSAEKNSSSPSTERRAPSAALSAVFWREGHRAAALAQGAALDLWYELEVDTYWGEPAVRLNVKELRLSE
jgi:single-stranded-DNA-specific exonuclease